MDATQPRPRQQLGSACDECRRRKLRCDRTKPQCLACVNSGVACVTRNECPPRGPRKGQVNALRNKIAILEARLSGQEKEANANRDQPLNVDSCEQSSDGDSELQIPSISATDLTTDFSNISAWFAPINPQSHQTDGSDRIKDPYPNLVLTSLDRSPVGTHLNPLVCSDLDQLYFDRVHTFAPLLQKVRYLSWSRQLDKPKQKVCLQYAMWALAASLSSQFQMIRDDLHVEARRLLESLEIENQDSLVTYIEQPQTWILLSIYELMNGHFERSLVSAGRAFRLIQLMGLYQVDRQPSPVSLSGDWIDTESIRRTFWVAYIFDRFTSVADGLPLTFDEREIGTRLPAPDSNFVSGQPTDMCFLSEVVSDTDSRGSNNALSGLEISPFAESVIMATIFGRVHNLKRHPAVEYGHDTAQGFSRQHQAINTLLMTRLQMLPIQIQFLQGHPDPIVVFLAISASMTIFMLYETIESWGAIAGALESMVTFNKERALDAARELGRLISVLSQLNHFETHPFTPIPLLLSGKFCLDHIGLDDSYESLIPRIGSALQGLTNVNGLAQNFLRILGLEAPATFCLPIS